ncbi:GIY-YIG nuclease family protein [Methylocella sp.]|jgi:putative endonuclease
MPGASIYILRCADGSYYTGLTRRSVDERVSEHSQKLVKGC